jgi:3-methyladenine DNA glycosylase AlkD
MQNKVNEIRQFCQLHANSDVVKKYSRYFVEGYDAYGLDQQTIDEQVKYWLQAWSEELKSINDWIRLGDLLVATGKYEEANFAYLFIKSKLKQATPDSFQPLGNWLEMGICNWAHTDGLSGDIYSYFILKKIIQPEALKPWVKSAVRWKRRAVPVSLIKPLKAGLSVTEILQLIEPLMADNERVVHQGMGWFLREAWKKYPEVTEQFLLKWKDSCARLIIQYATEKMDKSAKEKFKKQKQ